MECATGLPRRNFELSSMSSINNDALCNDAIMFLISDSTSIVLAASSFLLSALVASEPQLIGSTCSHNWKQSISAERMFLPGVEEM